MTSSENPMEEMIPVEDRYTEYKKAPLKLPPAKAGFFNSYLEPLLASCQHLNFNSKMPEEWFLYFHQFTF